MQRAKCKVSSPSREQKKGNEEAKTIPSNLDWIFKKPV
jgi:hypothetical protein